MIVVGVDPGTWPRDAQLAYIAGLIDGEGYVGAKRRMPSSANRMSAPKYSPTVSVEMTDAGPVQFVARFIGSPELPRWRQRGSNKPILSLQVENTRARDLLVAVRQFLIAKRERADLVIELADLRATSSSHRTKVVSTQTFVSGRAAGHDYRVFGLSDEFVAQCDSIYSRLLVGAARSGKGACFAGGTK